LSYRGKCSSITVSCYLLFPLFYTNPLPKLQSFYPTRIKKSRFAFFCRGFS